MIGIILFFVAVLMFWILCPLFLIYALFTTPNLSKYFRDMALSIDQLGNVTGAPIMNKVLLKKGAVVLYGNPDDTISFVTGVNYLNGTLTHAGLLVVKILNRIEPGHVEKAVKNKE